MAVKVSSAAMIAARPEAELLLLCARTRRDSQKDARIEALLGEEMDREYLLRAAHRHGMAPLLYWNLNAACPEDVPEDVLDPLRGHFIRNSRRALFLTGELLKLLGAFEAGEIPVISYKGPTLAALAYGNFALREFMDLDILVHRRDVPKARDLLISLGYRQQEKISAAQEEAFLESHCEYVFMNDNGSIVELHWAVMPRNLSFSLDPEDLWERSERVPFGGKATRVFSPEDMVLILCAHGAKHRWERLAWICDVAETIRANPDLDWNQLTARAEALGGERMLLLGLFLTSELLDAAIPAWILRKMKADRAVNGLAAQVVERWFGEPEASSGLLEESAFKPMYLGMRERMVDKVRYCFRTATARSVEDWETVTLPRYLFPFYYVIRAARLAGKYGRGLLGRAA